MLYQAFETIFGPYRLDSGRRTLVQGERLIDLGGRALDILIVLAHARGETVSRRNLLDQVWPGLTIEENNLHVQISILRKTLGKEWIVTVPRAGYRLSGVSADMHQTTVASLLPPWPVVAVLPFDNFSDDPKWDRFCDGLVDDIITGLAGHPDMSVVSRHSSFTYKGKAADVREIGRQLGARYLLEGSIQADSGRLRATGQLIDTATGTHVWAERFDVEQSGLFAVHDEIVDRLVAALVGPSGAISRETLAGIRRSPQASLQAYELYLLGYEQEARLDREGALGSIGLLKTALAVDRHDSRAWTTLAWTYGNVIQNRWTDDLTATQVEWHDAIRNAARTDPNDGLAAVALVGMHVREGDYQAAQLALERAQAVSARQADMLPWLARHLCTVVDRPEEGVGAMERALVLNPHPPYWYFLLFCQVAYFAERYDAVLSLYDRLMTDPAGQWTPLRSSKLFRLLALAQLGHEADVKAAASVLHESDPDLRQVAVDGAYLSPNARRLFMDGLSKAGIDEALIKPSGKH